LCAVVRLLILSPAADVVLPSTLCFAAREEAACCSLCGGKFAAWTAGEGTARLL
jgi:hypothetical protein